MRDVSDTVIVGDLRSVFPVPRCPDIDILGHGASYQVGVVPVPRARTVGLSAIDGLGAARQGQDVLIRGGTLRRMDGGGVAIGQLRPTTFGRQSPPFDETTAVIVGIPQPDAIL